MDKKSTFIQIITNKTLHLLIFILYFIIVVLLSLSPFTQNQPQIELPFIDKIVHFCFYFGMSILAFASINYNNKRHKGIIFFIILVAMFTIGGLIEMIQPYFNRTADIDDMAANALGAILGSISYVVFHNKIKQQLLNVFTKNIDKNEK